MTETECQTVGCLEEVSANRVALGYFVCLKCGEKLAKKRKFTIVPMPKSNYILVTDLALLRGLNSSHKGNMT
jgi:ribosomal protein L37AE/L43A